MARPIATMTIDAQERWELRQKLLKEGRQSKWKQLRSTHRLKISQPALKNSGGIFDYDFKKEKFEEVVLELENPDVWNHPEHAQALGKERAMLESVISTIDRLESGLQDVDEFLEMAELDEDKETFLIVCSDLAKLKN